jgi:hypothetical protein
MKVYDFNGNEKDLNPKPITPTDYKGTEIMERVYRDADLQFSFDSYGQNVSIEINGKISQIPKEQFEFVAKSILRSYKS